MYWKKHHYQVIVQDSDAEALILRLVRWVLICTAARIFIPAIIKCHKIDGHLDPSVVTHLRLGMRSIILDTGCRLECELVVYMVVCLVLMVGMIEDGCGLGDLLYEDALPQICRVYMS